MGIIDKIKNILFYGFVGLITVWAFAGAIYNILYSNDYLLALTWGSLFSGFIFAFISTYISYAKRKNKKNK